MFRGFSPETIDFLWGIRLNNERGWFMEHKQEYQKYLYEPMKALGEEIFSHFREVPNMAYKVSRIYRDARLHPPVPYKESLWLSMRPDNLPWSQQPTLYFEIRPEGYSYGFVLWQPKTDAMEVYRRQLLEQPEQWAKLFHQAEKATGFSVSGQEYKRRKECPELVAPYFNRKSIMMDTDRSPDELLFSPDLARTVTEALKALYPLYEACLGFTI